MLKKSTLLPSLLLLTFILTFNPNFAQENEPETILKAPENWQSEQFAFPLSFAPEINFSGFEDLRFAPGWSDTSSTQYWSYYFVWYIDQTEPLQAHQLENMLEAYYDGLMRVDQRNKVDSMNIDHSLAVFVETKTGFQGKVRTWDAFFSKAEMTLFVKVNESFCKDSGKKLITFEITQKPFSHEVWQDFKEVEVLVDCE